MVGVACRGAGAPSPGNPATPSRGDLAGRTRAIPAVQCLRESVGAELSRWWRTPDRLLSRHRVGPRKFAILLPDSGAGVVGPGGAQGDVCWRPLEGRRSERHFLGPN